MRSAEARELCRIVAIELNWPSGWESWREYWENACRSPSVIVPESTLSPPTTTTITKFRLPKNCVTGMLMPAINVAMNELSYSSRLRRSNSSIVSSSCP